MIGFLCCDLVGFASIGDSRYSFLMTASQWAYSHTADSIAPKLVRTSLPPSWAWSWPSFGRPCGVGAAGKGSRHQVVTVACLTQGLHSPLPPPKGQAGAVNSHQLHRALAQSPDTDLTLSLT